MSKNPKHHTPKKGVTFSKSVLDARVVRKGFLARVFFAIVVRRRPLRASSIYERVLLSYYRKRRRDDGSICDILVNERRDMMTTTSKDAFESIESFSHERSIGTKVSFYPLSRPRARRLTERPQSGRKCHFAPLRDDRDGPTRRDARDRQRDRSRRRCESALNKGGFFSSWVLCNNKGASSAREDEIAPYTFILE